MSFTFSLFRLPVCGNCVSVSVSFMEFHFACHRSLDEENLTRQGSRSGERGHVPVSKVKRRRWQYRSI